MRNYNIIVHDEKNNEQELIEESRKDYITGYSVEDNILKVKYDDGREMEYPYSEQIENDNLQKMEQQVRSAEKGYIEAKHKRHIKGVMALTFGFFTATFITLAIAMTLANAPIGTILFAIIAGSFGVGVYVDTKDYFRAKSVFNDYKKSKYFLDNKDELNKVEISNKVLKNTSRKTKRIVKDNSKGNKLYLNINLISKIPMQDLKLIRSHYKKQERKNEINFKDEPKIKKIGTR